MFCESQAKAKPRRAGRDATRTRRELVVFRLEPRSLQNPLLTPLAPSVLFPPLPASNPFNMPTDNRGQTYEVTDRGTNSQGEHEARVGLQPGS